MTSGPFPASIHRYRVLRELGRGAMGRVFLAEDPHLGRRIALKLLAPALAETASGADLRDRFLQEARVAGALHHPGIVTVFDADTDPRTGEPFLAMEWVDGRSLRDRLRQAGGAPLGVETAVTLAAQVAEALDFAHARGVVHRDIKPANLLIHRDGVKVADFGIAKLKSSPTLTLTGHVVGSPFYMAPEQIRGEELDGRADLFALGAVLYECLTGRLAFGGDSIASVSFKICEVDPRPPEIYNDRVPSALCEVLAKALQKRPAERYQNGAELAMALRALDPRRPAARRSSQSATWRDRRRAGHRALSTPKARPRQALTAVATLLLALFVAGVWGQASVYEPPTARTGPTTPRPAPALGRLPTGSPPTVPLPADPSARPVDQPSETDAADGQRSEWWDVLLGADRRHAEPPPRSEGVALARKMPSPAPSNTAAQPDRASRPPRQPLAPRSTAPIPPARLEVLHGHHPEAAYIAVWVDGERQLAHRIPSGGWLRRLLGRPHRRTIEVPAGRHRIEVHVSGIGRQRFEARQEIQAELAGNEHRRLVVKLRTQSKAVELSLKWKES